MDWESDELKVMNRKARKTNTLYGALQNELNNRWKNKKLYGIYVSMWEKCDRLHMKMRMVQERLRKVDLKIETHCVKSVLIRSFSGQYFPALGVNREDKEYLYIFSPNAGKYGPEKLWIWTLFMQWQKHWFVQLKNKQSLKFRLKYANWV